MKPEFRELQNAYIAELREVAQIASVWWRSLTVLEMDGNPRANISEVQRRWPNGPASHPRVIGVIVKYMHACEELNHGKDRSAQMPVSQFLIDGIDTRDSQDLVKFLSALSYWPVSARDVSGRRV